MRQDEISRICWSDQSLSRADHLSIAQSIALQFEEKACLLNF
jgi:hypothetical protein